MRERTVGGRAVGRCKGGRAVGEREGSGWVSRLEEGEDGREGGG